MDDQHPHPGLQAAIAKAGSVPNLARMLNFTPQRVRGWLKLRHGIPPEHVGAVASKTSISKAKLRPDLWEEEREHAPRAEEG